MGKYDHLTREELIDRLEKAEQSEAAKLRDRLDGERRIAHALMLMLKNYDTSYEEDIMRIVLERYQADRAFLFKFDWEKGTNRNLYEVNAEGISSEIDNLQNLPNEALVDYLEQFRKGIPLVINDVGQMKPTTYRGTNDLQQTFRKLGLKSAVLFPMRIFGELWGYVGMETVRNYRHWSADDLEWLGAFTDVMSIGVSQRFVRAKANSNERRFTELFAHMPVGYIRHRMICGENNQPIDYEYLEMNPAFEKLTGLRKEDCIGKTARQIGREVDNTMFEVYKKVAYENRQTQVDYFVPMLNRWFYSVLYSPQRGEFISLFYDITERIKVSQQIQINEEKLKTILENLPVGVISFDSSGHFQNTNGQAIKIFPCLQDIHADRALHLSALSRKELEAKGEISFNFIYDARTEQRLLITDHIPEGALYLNTKIIKYTDANGDCTGYLLIAVDNTTLKTANLQLKEAQKTVMENLVRLSLILETGKIYPWYMDLETGALDISEEFYKAFGHRKEDHKNYTIQNFIKQIHPDDAQAFREEFEKLQNGIIKRIKIEIRINILNKGYKWCELNGGVRSRGDGSKITKWLGFLTIIQQRKDNEQQLIEALKKAEESDKLKSAFLANVSHEIRTPLNAIVGFSELIATTDSEEDKNYYLDIVKTNNNLLLNLINDILDLSKIESGRMDLKESPVNIRELCQEICNVQQLRAAPGVDVIFATPDEPLTMQTDRNRLTQLYSNLISNAIKYTSEGSISIGYQRKGQYIEFFVRDTGKGISKDKQAFIFNRFEKLNSNVQGFGLGLAICKSILEKMQGSITLTSEEGKGTEFRFTLPYQRVAAQPTEMRMTQPVEETGPLPDRPVILVAEDIDCNYELFEAHLKEQYTLVRAVTGIEAVSLFSSENPNLILMDMKMPELDGIEATQIIREVSPTIPIIAVTAFAYDCNKEDALQAGCTDFLTKPVEAEQLRTIVEKYLSRN